MTNNNQSLSEDQFKFLKTTEEEWIQTYYMLNKMPPLTLSVYGGAKLLESDKAYKDTVIIGEKLSNLGWGMVTGGGPGAMKAALVGGNKGKTETTAFKIDLSREVTTKVADNEFMFSNFPPRKHGLRQSDAYLVVPGGWGTFDELFEVITLQKVNKIPLKPVILYDSMFWKPLISWLKNEVLKRGLVKKEEIESIFIFDTPEEVINFLSKN
jgi:uncharacterized protein (TIGR00730 family)